MNEAKDIPGVELTLFFGLLDLRIWQILRFDHQFQNLDHLILKCYLHFHFCFKRSDLLLQFSIIAIALVLSRNNIPFDPMTDHLGLRILPSILL